MWVVVQRKASFRVYEGVLDNDPRCTKEIQSGMKVVFEPRHIIQIRSNAALYLPPTGR
jgi:hypothetical protein